MPLKIYLKVEVKQMKALQYLRLYMKLLKILKNLL